MRLVVCLFVLIIANCSFANAECNEREFTSDQLLVSPVCIPNNPKRIVVLDAALTLGAAMELELPVAGAPLFKMSDKLLHERAKNYGIESVGKFTAPDVEKILAMQPDMIIGSAFLGDGVYNMASQVAPTVFLKTADWKTYIHTLADLGGEKSIALANQKFTAYDKRIAELRANMPDKTVSIVRITNWDFQVYLDKPDSYAPFAIASEAGVKRTAYEMGEKGQVIKRPDYEELGNLTGETLLYIIGGANDSDTSGRYEEVFGNPLWQLLPAVQSGKVYRIDAGTWMEFSGFYAADRILDEIEKFVIKGEAQ